MSSPHPDETQATAVAGVAGGGEVRTYRGRSVEELIPQIRSELGEGAIILRERQGLSGGVAGFFAQRCVEIQAQAGPRVSVMAGDDLEDQLPLADVDEELELSDAEFEVAAGLSVGATQLPEVRAFAASLQAAAVPAPQPALAGEPRPSFRAQPIAPPRPAFDPVQLPVPIAIERVPAAPLGPFRAARPAPAHVAPGATTRALAPFSPVTVTRPHPLAERLETRGMTTAFAQALAHGIDEVDELRSHLAAILPPPAALPVTGGAIAVVGSGGTGKTRTVAALAAVAARAGHTVTVARLGSHERQRELAELLAGEPVEVLPTMRTRATARAVAAARETGLVIVDTTPASPSDRSALEVLSETLEQFAFEGVLLAVPTTFNARAAERLADGFEALPLTGLIATHADECSELGAVAELAIRHRLALGHVHSGLDVSIAVQTLDPTILAQQLL